MPCFVIVIVVTITVYSAAHFGASMSIVVATPFSLLKIKTKTKTIPKLYSCIIINLTVLCGHSYLVHYLSSAAFTKYTRCHIWICMYVVI